MADEKIQLDITAKDDASAKIDKIAGKAEKLEKLNPEIEVDADTRKAERNLEEVSDAAKELDRQDVEIALDAKVGDLKAQLREAEAALEAVRDKAEDTSRATEDIGDRSKAGSVNSVNATRDMLGPLGEVSSQVGDVGEAFSAFGETAVAKLGLAGTKAGELALTALPAVGLAVGAAIAVWGKWKAAQAEVNERIDEGIELLREAASDGFDPFVRKARDLIKEDQELAASMDRLGISGRDLADALQGDLSPAVQEAIDLRTAYREAMLADAGPASATINAVEDLAAAHGWNKDELEGNVAEAENFVDALNDQVPALGVAGEAMVIETRLLGDLEEATEDTATGFDRLKAAIDMQASWIAAQGDADALAGSLEELHRMQGDATTSAEDLADQQRVVAGDTNRLQQTVLGLVDQYGEIPEEEKTRILAELPVEQQAAFDAWMRTVEAEHIAPVKVEFQPQPFEATFSNGSKIRLRNYGGDDVVTEPTLFMAGEHGHPERVRITPGLGTGSNPGIAAPTQPPQVFTYNINLPRGTRGTDLVATMDNHARRNGARLSKKRQR